MKGSAEGGAPVETSGGILPRKFWIFSSPRRDLTLGVLILGGSIEPLELPPSLPPAP